MAGGGPFTLTVNGSNFISTSTVRWNGTTRTTTFKSSTQLTATIASADIAAPGTAQVTVFNPAPGGGTSNAVVFTISNPPPMVSSISPSSAVATGPGFTMDVLGSSFTSNSVVRWNGADRQTIFFGPTKVQATILSTDIASPGQIPVTVFDAGPPAFTSNAVQFTITPFQTLVINTKSLPPSATGKDYDFVLQSTGGVPPVRWFVSTGSLPQGTDLTSNGQILSFMPLTSATTANFTVEAVDSASTQHTATQPLTIQVFSSLSRNDNVCVSPGVLGTDQPVPISNGTLRASISPHGDVDTYSFVLTQTVTDLTIETFAQQLAIGTNLSQRSDFLDSVLELLDGNCNLIALNDDIQAPGVIQDSMIHVGSTPFPANPPANTADKAAPASLPAGTYFIRVRDFRGDGRPDLIYDLQLSGAQ